MFSGLNPELEDEPRYGGTAGIGDVIHLLNSARGYQMPSESTGIPPNLVTDEFLESLKEDNVLGGLNDTRTPHDMGIPIADDPIAAREVANASHNLSMSLQKKHSLLQEYAALSAKNTTRFDQQLPAAHGQQPQPQHCAEDPNLVHHKKYASMNAKYGLEEFDDDDGSFLF